MAVQGSGLQRFRHIRRLPPVKGPDPASPADQRTDLHSSPHTETARSLRAHQAFMPGKTQHIYTVLFHINREFSGRLGSVNHKQRSLLPAELPDPSDIHYISGQIRSVGADHSPGPGPDAFFYPFVVYRPP